MQMQESVCFRSQGHTSPIRSLLYIQGDDPVKEKKKKTKTGEDGEEEDEAEEENEEEEEEEEYEDWIHPRDMLITGSFDGTARSWSMMRGRPIKVGPRG